MFSLLYYCINMDYFRNFRLPGDNTDNYKMITNPTTAGEHIRIIYFIIIYYVKPQNIYYLIL